MSIPNAPPCYGSELWKARKTQCAVRRIVVAVSSADVNQPVRVLVVIQQCCLTCCHPVAAVTKIPAELVDLILVDRDRPSRLLIESGVVRSDTGLSKRKRRERQRPFKKRQLANAGERIHSEWLPSNARYARFQQPARRKCRTGHP